MRYFLSAVASLFVLSFEGGAVAQMTADASPLVSDISTSNIEIRYSFAGADLLLFGAILDPQPLADGAARDIVVVVRGPEADAMVRRKDRVAGIWINSDALQFDQVPGYYAVASTRPLSEVTDAEVLRELNIGFDHLQLPVAVNDLQDAYPEFRQALIRNRERDGLYRQTGEGVSLRNGTLFRTDVSLPSNVPVGNYRAEVYLFEGGQNIARTETDINVDKEGFERFTYTLAHDHPALYGLIAIIIAVFAGWVAGVLGKK